MSYFLSSPHLRSLAASTLPSPRLVKCYLFCDGFAIMDGLPLEILVLIIDHFHDQLPVFHNLHRQALVRQLCKRQSHLFRLRWTCRTFRHILNPHLLQTVYVSFQPDNATKLRNFESCLTGLPKEEVRMIQEVILLSKCSHADPYSAPRNRQWRHLFEHRRGWTIPRDFHLTGLLNQLPSLRRLGFIGCDIAQMLRHLSMSTKVAEIKNDKGLESLRQINTTCINAFSPSGAVERDLLSGVAGMLQWMDDYTWGKQDVLFLRLSDYDNKPDDCRPDTSPEDVCWYDCGEDIRVAEWFVLRGKFPPLATEITPRAIISYFESYYQSNDSPGKRRKRLTPFIAVRQPWRSASSSESEHAVPHQLLEWLATPQAKTSISFPLLHPGVEAKGHPYFGESPRRRFIATGKRDKS
ncbi:uncharacterized protein B0I36DRAFT_58197 [Microdochium trichocladiopsis]|uniref:F-box domain-containing protein n=1 Tax=Microdochium trichocladiopsis TaxID=1682393 RepID=A0A9P9BHD4_9PEZI|nr:uncharacterized protein B0I36DRAFT_58197 [Microdochium trichocladiopsis]KAH7010669.1 hypothetical protein B0I36DRAFT_58197 [Microdochium trichocladiopsis]